MKHYLAPILLAIGVAATPFISFCEEGVEPPYGYYDPGDGGQPIGLYTIEQFQAAMQQAKASVDEIASAAAKQKEQINTLWQEASQLVDGLKEDIGKLEKLVELSDAENGFVTTDALNEWINGEYADKISEIEESLKTKKDKDDDDDDDDPPDLSGYLKEEDAESTYLKKEDAESKYLTKDSAESTYAKQDDLDALEERVEALENPEEDPDNPGGGCDDNCKNSWANLAGFFDDLALYSAGENESCGSISFGGTINDWIDTFGFVVAGEPPDGHSFAQAFTDTENMEPLFNAAPGWLGDGLEFGDGSGENGLTPIDVKVTESVAGNLGSNLDGTSADGESWSGVAVVDSDGHLRAGAIGTISVAADGTTIERTKVGNEDAPTLKVKTSGIVDGQTIQVSGKLAHVNPGALCDNTTIGTDNNGKLCVKKDAVSYTYPWDFGDGSFKNAYVLYGGRSVSASGTNIGNNTDADYYVKVTVSGDTATAVVTTSSTKPSNGWAVFVGHVKNGVLTSGIKTTPAFLVYE